MKTRVGFHRMISLILALILCAAAGGSTAQARPQAISIQLLIDNAIDGATVSIPTDTYTESLRITRNNLTLKGNPNARPIIGPSVTPGPVISVDAGFSVTLEGLYITGGQNLGGLGGGVYLADGSLTLKDSLITRNSAKSGGGVYQGGKTGSLLVDNSQIEGNSATEGGGGLFAQGSATLKGLSLVVNNSAGTYGGGIYADYDLTINGSQFNKNTAALSGGAVTQWSLTPSVSISNASFNDNTARRKGGAVFIQSSPLTLTRSTFTKNVVDSGGSGDVNGGGLFAGGRLDGSGLTFTGNQARCTVCNLSSGGGIFIDLTMMSPVLVADSAFSGNLARDGGGIGAGPLVLLSVTGSSFMKNGDPANTGAAHYGGGVFAYWLKGDRLSFLGNQVQNGGGAIAATILDLTRVSFIGNQATNNGAGGGIFISSNGSFTGSNLLFVDNGAATGSTVRLGPGVSSGLKHITLASAAQGSGAAIRVDATGSLTLQNSILANANPGFSQAGTLNEDHNLFFNIGAFIPGLTSLSADPLFADPAAGDYHLRSNSPAIGLGANRGVATDLDGLPRNNRWDAGACQFYYRALLPAAYK